MSGAERIPYRIVIVVVRFVRLPQRILARAVAGLKTGMIQSRIENSLVVVGSLDIYRIQHLVPSVDTCLTYLIETP